MWAMTRKLGLSKLKSGRTFIDFSWQCILKLEDRRIVKRKMYWDKSKSFSASELLWAELSSYQRSEKKKPFFLKSHMIRWLYHLEETAWVETSWHWVDTEQHCFCIQQVVGCRIGTETLGLKVLIVRGNLTFMINSAKNATAGAGRPFY